MLLGDGKSQEKAPPVGGAGIQEWILFYAFSFRLNAPARPTKPVPRRVKLPGSGTITFVSPLEIVVDPLKNPLPVLTVSCTVTPCALEPLYHVPESEPVRV